jgi:hypothetical protein
MYELPEPSVEKPLSPSPVPAGENTMDIPFTDIKISENAPSSKKRFFYSLIKY